MWRRFGLLYVFQMVSLSVTFEAISNVKAADVSILSSTSSSSSNANGGWHMKAVTSIQARVQGDAPIWNDKAQMWLSQYGDTIEAAYRNNLDTVNTASVEGALMFVQAEGINVKEQSIPCQRKNNMQYIVFYEITIVQPTYGIKYYENHSPPEYGEFVAVDGGKCTDKGNELPEDCEVYYGLDKTMDIGPMVGSNLQTSDPRAPYPGNYWFSYPGSCAQKMRADKTDKCRTQYPGGLCGIGIRPDGDNCNFSYKILGFLNIDDLVGITTMGYRNYRDFCKDGGVEFQATNTGNGFKMEQAIDFWKHPEDENANFNRTFTMVNMYNELAASTTNMVPLPSIDTLTSANPKCNENSATCANAPNGCRRELYSQICFVCSALGPGCSGPSSFPELQLPVNPMEDNGSSMSDSSTDADTGSTSATSNSSGSKTNYCAAYATMSLAIVVLVAMS
ncbi:hypothetical protein CCR75_005308 [Bremia lactucae]|uniref:Uncharacterized protein n=1 Tax=Bremia lactucae TaxID=4779 RepID=A0A976IGK3_BRELC|nr:hypothetical protein CCR75_005308 [Bremia lactucae]